MWDTMRAVVTREVIGLVGRRYGLVELRLCEHDAARRLIWRDAARPLLTRGHDAWRAMLGHNESCREVKASA